MKRHQIERMLPEIFRRTLQPGSPLMALLDVMAQLPEPSEKVLEELDSKFDPRTTSEDLVVFLSSWVDLEWLVRGEGVQTDLSRSPVLSSGLGRLRETVAAANRLSKWRGTAYGMEIFLTTATGIEGFEIDEEVLDQRGAVKPFHIHVKCPASAKKHRILIERIVEREKPAYVTSAVKFAESE